MDGSFKEFKPKLEKSFPFIGVTWALMFYQRITRNMKTKYIREFRAVPCKKANKMQRIVSHTTNQIARYMIKSL